MFALTAIACDSAANAPVEAVPAALAQAPPPQPEAAVKSEETTRAARERSPAPKFVNVEPPPPIEELQNVTTIPDDTHITLKRVDGTRNPRNHTVTINARGQVVVEDDGSLVQLDGGEYASTARFDVVDGLRVPAKQGWTKSYQLSPQAMRALLARFGTVGFLDISQAALDANCEGRQPHSNTIITTLTFKGRTTKVVHHLACGPKESDLHLELVKLEREIQKQARLKEFWLWLVERVTEAEREAKGVQPRIPPTD